MRELLDASARQGAPLSFADIAREADVSRNWLYTSPFADEIKEQRSRRPKAHVRAEPASAQSLRARLDDALDENTRLREELAEIRRQLAIALGERRSNAI